MKVKCNLSLALEFLKVMTETLIKSDFLNDG